jgi:hypothetical protein
VLADVELRSVIAQHGRGQRMLSDVPVGRIVDARNQYDTDDSS